MVSVRQTRDLPSPSFRFAVTHDTLGLSYILPATRADLGLSPISDVRRKAHEREDPNLHDPCPLFLFSSIRYIILRSGFQHAGQLAIQLILISVRIIALPSPGIRTHIPDAVLCFPAQLPLRLICIRVAGCDISGTSVLNHIRNLYARCILEVLHDVQYAHLYPDYKYTVPLSPRSS